MPRSPIRTIYLPAIERTVTLHSYLQAVRLAKRNPKVMFDHGLTTWWPTTGAEIMRQFREGMMERINEGIPYSKRGTD